MQVKFALFNDLLYFLISFQMVAETLSGGSLQEILFIALYRYKCKALLITFRIDILL